MYEFDLFATMRAVRRSNLPSTQRAVLLAILDFWSKSRPVPFPSMDLLAADTGFSERAVQNAIKALDAAGVVAVSRKKNRSNRYDVSGTRIACLLRPNQRREKWAEKQLEKIGFIRNDVPSQPEPGAVTQQHDVPSKIPSSSIQKEGAALFSPTVVGDEPAAASSSPEKNQKKSEAKHPRDSSTLELERFYADQFQTAKFVAWSGTIKPDARARRAFKDLIAQVGGLEDAKGVVAAAFADPWTVEHAILPWEIQRNRDKHRGIALDKADETIFRLRSSNDSELEKQRRFTPSDPAGHDRVVKGEYIYTNPSWMFRHGFNPENTSWLNRQELAQDQWAIEKAHNGEPTARFRRMMADKPKVELCRVAFLMGRKPDKDDKFVLWPTDESKKLAATWYREWHAEEAKKAAGQ